MAGLAGVLLIAGSGSLHRAAENAVTLVGSFIGEYPVAGALAFTGLAALSAMLAFFSSALVVPVGIFHWGASLTCFLLWLGWLLGGVASYCIGRFLGGRIMRILTSPSRAQYYQDRISHRAPFGAILLFQAAVPSEIPGYVLGTVRYPFPSYLAALALAELPYAIGAVFLGSGFLRRQYWLIGALGLLGIAFVTWAVTRLHRTLGPYHEPSFRLPSHNTRLAGSSFGQDS
jgi:uncharacterized membrane protein YdjX (TVP38/TMEM64 family)